MAENNKQENIVDSGINQQEIIKSGILGTIIDDMKNANIIDKTIGADDCYIKKIILMKPQLIRFYKELKKDPYLNEKLEITIQVPELNESNKKNRAEYDQYRTPTPKVYIEKDGSMFYPDYDMIHDIDEDMKKSLTNEQYKILLDMSVPEVE
jgi:hypothetical protein